MNPSIKSALVRGSRVLVSLLIAGVAVKYGHSDWYLAISPVLNSVSKYVRDEFGIDILVV